MIEKFMNYLQIEGKSENTIKSYRRHIKGYNKWYIDTFGNVSTKLYRMNVLDFKCYLQNVKKDKARTINAKLSALIKYNEFLVDEGIQDNIVVSKKDNVKIQQQMANPTEITKKDVEAFRQRILENCFKRDYAIVTILAYAGLRISEVLELKINDVDLIGKEVIVRSGKGDKQRTVYINDKIVNAVKEYLKERNSGSEYLFVSRQSNKVNRTRINQIFNCYSKNITPHKLRHYWCTSALEAGYTIHEVANQAGHSNIHTTLIYTNPTRAKMKEKANLL